MKQFLCECKKTRGKLVSVLLPVLAIILIWIFWIIHDPSETDIKQGYTYLQTTLLLLNSIFLSVTIAVMASRLIDMETKGNTFKLLCTLQKKSSIFSVKLLLALLHLLAFFGLETAGIYAIGQLIGIEERFPLMDYFQLQGIGLLSGILLFILQIFFSLRLENQLYPLFIGLIGSFIGLFSMFFPPKSVLMRFCPWSWFLLGSSHQMLWDEQTEQLVFPRVSFDITGFLIMLAALILAFFAVRRYFLRKEV